MNMSNDDFLHMCIFRKVYFARQNQTKTSSNILLLAKYCVTNQYFPRPSVKNQKQKLFSSCQLWPWIDIILGNLYPQDALAQLIEGFFLPAQPQDLVLRVPLLILPAQAQDLVLHQFPVLLLLLLSTCQYVRHATSGFDLVTITSVWTRTCAMTPICGQRLHRGHRVQKGHFHRNAVSPLDYRVWSCDSCIFISLIPSTKIIRSNFHLGSFVVTWVKMSFSPKILFLLQNAITRPCYIAWQ